MPSELISTEYTVTTDPSFLDIFFNNPPALVEQMEPLYFEMQDSKNNKKMVKKLTDLIVQYPDSPQLKNYLSVAYANNGNYNKAFEVNRRIVTKHPDYLFGKLNLAKEYINKKQFNKVPQVLGEDMEIQALYPNRTLFHLAEITGFYNVVILYLVKIKNFELAENRLEILRKIAPDHPDTEAATDYLFDHRMTKALERMKKTQADRIVVKCLKPIPSSEQEETPVFNNAIIKNLYQFGFEIPTDKLEAIIALPMDTLIEDLQKVLADAVDRYRYFGSLNWNEKTHTFPLHAICILGHLKAESSLPAIFDFLKNDESVLEFWLGEHLNDTIWMPLYLLSQNNLSLQEEFLLAPGITSWAKNTVWKTLAQLALHQPAKKEAVTIIYKKVLDRFNNASLNDNIIDSIFLGIAMDQLMALKLVELLPVVKELFEKNHVDTTINGDYQETEELITDLEEEDEVEEVKGIFDLYHHFWVEEDNFKKGKNAYDNDMHEEDFEDGDLNDLSDNYSEDEYYKAATTSSVAGAVKVGRNDPCPCGSGKKYKKCCIDK